MKYCFRKNFNKGRCGVSPLEGGASNEVRARGRLSPFIRRCKSANRKS